MDFRPRASTRHLPSPGSPPTYSYGDRAGGRRRRHSMITRRFDACFGRRRYDSARGGRWTDGTTFVRGFEQLSTLRCGPATSCRPLGCAVRICRGRRDRGVGRRAHRPRLPAFRGEPACAGSRHRAGGGGPGPLTEARGRGLSLDRNGLARVPRPRASGRLLDWDRSSSGITRSGDVSSLTEEESPDEYRRCRNRPPGGQEPVKAAARIGLIAYGTPTFSCVAWPCSRSDNGADDPNGPPDDRPHAVRPGLLWVLVLVFAAVALWRLAQASCDRRLRTSGADHYAGRERGPGRVSRRCDHAARVAMARARQARGQEAAGGCSAAGPAFIVAVGWCSPSPREGQHGWEKKSAGDDSIRPEARWPRALGQSWSIARRCPWAYRLLLVVAAVQFDPSKRRARPGSRRWPPAVRDVPACDRGGGLAPRRLLLFDAKYHRSNLNDLG